MGVFCPSARRSTAYNIWNNGVMVSSVDIDRVPHVIRVQ